MPKYVWLVQCPQHKSIKRHFTKKSEAHDYYMWHHKLANCFYVMKPELIEAPFVG